MTPTPNGIVGLELTRRVGAGGEAEVFEVANRPGIVCKQYLQPTRERAEKLRVMLEHPPEGTRAGSHISIAWPTELVFDEAGHVAAFLMPRIDVRAAVPVFHVYNPATRLRVAPGFTWRYLVRTARNVAAIVDSIHRGGHVIGDLNESNLLVDRRALVALVDCDSMQIVDPSTGRIYRSTVGKPEFLAPELHGRDLSTTDRTARSDAFALAVMIHQLLLEGVHPHAGVWRGRGDPPDIATRIRRGWVAGRRGWSPVDRPPHALSSRMLPRDVRALLRRGLATRPRRRPEAWEWIAVLDALDGSLRVCSRSEHHHYAGRSCPWCLRIDRGLPDPFPGPAGVSPLVPRGPSLFVRIRRGAVRGAKGAARLAGRGLRVSRLVGVVGAVAVAGWAWPVAAPLAVGLVVVPVVYTVATPSRHVARALLASVQILAQHAPLGAAVSTLAVGWPDALRASSALTSVLHGVVVPAAFAAWRPARVRLARIPWLVVWAASFAVSGAAIRLGW